MKYKKLTLKDFGIKREEKTLKNGCRVILYKKKNSPLFMKACFLAGSRFDPKGKEGLAHFIEHMLVSKTKNFATKDKLAMSLERYGGSFSLATNNNFIYINGEVGDIRDLDVLMNFLNEVINNPVFTKKNFLTEKGSIINEIGNFNLSPSSFFSEIFLNTFYKETPLEKNTLGTEESLKKINLKDIIVFYNKNITPQNCTIIACGDIKIDELIKKIEQKIKFKNKGNNEMKRIVYSLPTEGKKIFLNNALSNQSLINIGFRVPSGFNYSPEIEAIGMILADGRASRLKKKLRYDKGLVYAIYSSYMTYQDAGGFLIKTTANQKTVDEVIKIIFKELDGIRRDGVTKEELSFIKDKIYKSVKIDLQTAKDWVNDNYSLEILYKNKETRLDLVNKIIKVTNKDIIKISNKYLSEEKAYVGIYTKDI